MPGKQPKNSCKTPEACNWLPVRLSFACFPALCPGPTRHLFRLFFGCFQGPAFGASVAGRGDRNSREQKRHIRKSHVRSLKTPWMARCLWDTRPVSRQTCPFRQFLYSKRRKSLGYWQGHPAGVFLEFMCPFLRGPRMGGWIRRG